MGDCSELAQTITDLAMNIASDPDVKSVDDVVTIMKKTTPLMNRQMVVDSIVEATEGKSQQVDALVKKLNDIKQEARTDKKLQRKIDSLAKTLQSGETLTPKKRQKAATKAIESLRGVRDDLKKKISKSEPEQKKRLEKQIKDLTKRIETGDIQPKQKKVDVPQSKQLERLQFKRDKLQGEIRRQINNLKPKSFFENVIQEPFNTARGIMTAFDFSAVFRQGGFIVVGHPVRAIKALGPMFKAFASEQQQAKIDKSIHDRPNAPLYKKAGLFIAPIDGSYKLSAREEIMQAKLLDKIPGVAASNRAYTTFLNVLRVESFDVMVAGLTKTGEATLDEAKAVANYVNVATGRGSLGKFEQAASGLNVAFFAPRYVASRFQLLGGALAEPVRAVAGKNKRVSRQITKEYARYLIGMTMVYALAALTLDDEEFELDPTSSDFGKIKIGSTRLDPLSGISQITVLLSRLATGKLKSSTTGNVISIRGDDVGFGKATAAGVVGSFMRYKLSPMFGTGMNLLTGEDAIHEPFGIEDVPGSLFIPISFKEILETMEAQGMARGTALSTLAIFGMGVQTYGSQIDKDKQKVKFK